MQERQESPSKHVVSGDRGGDSWPSLRDNKRTTADSPTPTETQQKNAARGKIDTSIPAMPSQPDPMPVMSNVHFPSKGRSGEVS